MENWETNDEEYEDITEEIMFQLKNSLKISLLKIIDPLWKTWQNCLLIQTDKYIYFYQMNDVAGFRNLIEKDFTVQLQMLRGLNNRFYFALRDPGAASDALHVLSFTTDSDTQKVAVINEPIPAAYTGEILSFELDPLNSNDIESYHQDNDIEDGWLDKLD